MKMGTNGRQTVVILTITLMLTIPAEGQRVNHYQTLRADLATRPNNIPLVLDNNGVMKVGISRISLFYNHPLDTNLVRNQALNHYKVDIKDQGCSSH